MMIYKHKSMKNTVFKIMQKVNFWIARTTDIAKYVVKSDNFQRTTITQRMYVSIEYISL